MTAIDVTRQAAPPTAAAQRLRPAPRFGLRWRAQCLRAALIGG